MYKELHEIEQVFDNLRRMWTEYEDTDYRYSGKRGMVINWHDGYISYLMGELE